MRLCSCSAKGSCCARSSRRPLRASRALRARSSLPGCPATGAVESFTEFKAVPRVLQLGRPQPRPPPQQRWVAAAGHAAPFPRRRSPCFVRRRRARVLRVQGAPSTGARLPTAWALMQGAYRMLTRKRGRLLCPMQRQSDLHCLRPCAVCHHLPHHRHWALRWREKRHAARWVARHGPHTSQRRHLEAL
jgi:hypothetical protein